MKTLTKDIPARELPADWQAEGQFAPDEQVTVMVEPKDTELAQAASLEELMTVIGRRAEVRGLTEKRLAQILNER